MDAPLSLPENYSARLTASGLGFPVAFPDFSSICVGDVGWWQDGNFYTLFNIIRSREDYLNYKGVPEGFQVFSPADGQPGDGVDTREILPGPICGPTVQVTKR